MMHRQQNQSSSSSSSNEVYALYPSAAYHPSHSTLPSSKSSSSMSSLSPSFSSSSFRSSSTTSCPILLSLLTWSLTFLLISSCIGFADAGIIEGRPLSKRSFFNLQCKGVYDKSIFARLDRICEDCYNLFREPQLHILCKKNCFTTDYFKGCIDVLLMQDEIEKIQMWIKQIHGADPGV